MLEQHTFDLWMPCYLKGSLQNFHLLAFLMLDHHTGDIWRNECPCPKLKTSAHWYNNRWCICYDWLCTRNMHLIVKRISWKYFSDVVDEQFCKLHLAFKEESVFSQMLQNAQACSTVQSFEQCWSPLGSKFEDLQRVCGVITSFIPGTSSVK